MIYSQRPDFLVAGVQKGGTTSLFRYLVQHPHVMRAARKEVGYFSDQFGRGPRWYEQQFPTRGARLRMSLRRRARIQTGEATPFYLFHPRAPERVKAFCPDVRVVVMLRDPVERAYSHYRHHVKLGEETLDFEAAIDAEAERLDGELARMLAEPDYESEPYRLYSYLARGVYVDQLTRWFEHFERESMLILSSEAFFADPEAAFVATQEFLGLPVVPRTDYEQFNPGKKEGIAAGTRDRLRDYFRPHNVRLTELLQQEFGWDD